MHEAGDEGGHVGALDAKHFADFALGEAGAGVDDVEDAGFGRFKVQGCQSLGKIGHDEHGEAAQVVAEQVFERVFAGNFLVHDSYCVYQFRLLYNIAL